MSKGIFRFISDNLIPLIDIVSGMNHAVPESVENNGDSVAADNPEAMNQRPSESIEKVSVNGSLVLPDDDHEEGTGSPQESNKDEGSEQRLRRKGFGLKKWRRIKRDGPVKDEAGAAAAAAPPVDDGGKLLKRGLTGSVNPPSKHVDVSSVEARQSSEEGSVGSVNMVHHHHPHHPGLASGFSPDPGFMSFTVGQAFEKSQEHSGNSKNVGGKIVSGNDTIKKSSGDRAKTEDEKPCSSVDSDLRSSDFVFSSGAVSVANHTSGEKDERLVMNHIGGFSKQGQVREEQVQTHSRSENDQDGGNKSKKNNHYWGDKDQIADSIRNLSALQEALWKGFVT